MSDVCGYLNVLEWKEGAGPVEMNFNYDKFIIYKEISLPN